MSITDVNAAFAAEKRAQLDTARADRDATMAAQANQERWVADEVTAGRLIRIGADRYRIATGWDEGETITVVRTGDRTEIVPDHGLDLLADGTPALYLAAPAWHDLGQVIPGGTTDVATVLGLSGLDFTVETVPALYEWDGRVREHTDRFHTVRTDTGAALGVVGRRYHPIQNTDGFAFLQELVGESGVVWESAGPLKGGARVFVSIRLPDTVTVDADGINDEIVPYVAVMNDHSGRGQFQCVVTPWRPVCANTERFAVRDAHTTWSVRHTSGATDRIREARRTLGLTVRYYDEWVAEETALARTDIAIDDFHRTVADLWPLDDDATGRKVTTRTARADALDARFRTEIVRVGMTAYAAERAITGYLDHVAPRRPGKTMTEEIARATAALTGADDDVKSKAHRQLMVLTRR
ncbi:DUF932 domain-containing protein [Streptomyces uncialis]|uniref:DUF932 domain-containing protein n=1 Tax=Streptomyces uncialis TaxID=1048205 RepID=UPI0036683E73